MGNENDSHGFKQDDNGIWPDSGSNGPENSTGDSGKDFDGLTWKQIEAAILGGGSMTGGQDQLDRAYSNVNWQSLQAAAGVFQTTQLTLNVVAQAIKQQTEALAGADNGAWKGTAAKNFSAMMNDMAGKFDGLVHQITDGSSGGRNIPNQLANSAAYLQWAQNTLRYIDSYYAQQVIARGKVLNDGRAFISQFPEAVEMMTNDMRAVGNTLSGEYHGFSVASYNPAPPQTPTPDAPPPPPPPPPPPEPPNVPPPPDAPPPPNIPPPPGGSGGGGGGDLPPPPSIPPPPGDTGGGGGGDVPPPPTIPPPPGGTGGGGGGDLPPLSQLSSIPPPPGGGDGPGGLGGINPPGIDGPPGTTGGTDGLGGIPPFTAPSLTPPPTGTGGKNGDTKGGNLGDIKPPALDGPPGTSGLGDGGLGDIKAPSLGGPPAGTGLGGANGLGNGLPNSSLNPADLPPGLQNPNTDTKGGGFTSAFPPGGMPMMPPGGMGGGMNPPGSERPDSSGLLGGVDKPWQSALPDGLGDPNALADTPPLTSASWAPPPGAGGGGGGVDVPGGSGTANPGGIKGLDESQLVPPPSLPSSNTNGQLGGMPGGMPMMPPGGMGGGMNPPSAERPDSSGLLGNVKQPWDSALPDGLGDPSSFGETPPLESASWAPPATDGPGEMKGLDETSTPQQQATPGMPMMPPGGMGGGMNPPSAERPDSSGLLGGVDAPWTAVTPDSVGDPVVSGETPPSQAAWGPMVPPAAMNPATETVADRPESAGLLDGTDVAWTAGTPAGTGDPGTTGVTPAVPAAPWAPATPPSESKRPESAELIEDTEAPWTPQPQQEETRGGWAAAVPVAGWGTAKSTSDDRDDVVRIGVVHPQESTVDTSAWDVGTAEFLPGLLPVGLREEREEEITTDHLERSDEPWRPADEEPKLATYQRLRIGQGEFIPDELPTCGDGPLPEEDEALEEAEAEGDEEEEEERTMADLLSQDGAAWGRPANRESGVLE